MAIINKEGIVRRINDKMGEGLTKSDNVLEKVIETIVDILKEGHAVRIKGFGVFTLKHVKERVINIPLKGEGTSNIAPAHTGLQFKMSHKLKEQLNDVQISNY